MVLILPFSTFHQKSCPIKQAAFSLDINQWFAPLYLSHPVSDRMDTRQ
jgi:hypothetical protein